MKINTKTILKNVNGIELKTPDNRDFTLGEGVSNILTSVTENEIGGKMKIYSLGLKFYNDEEVELDTADLSLVKRVVDNTKVYTSLVTGQILTIIEETK